MYLDRTDKGCKAEKFLYYFLQIRINLLSSFLSQLSFEILDSKKSAYMLLFIDHKVQ